MAWEVPDPPDTSDDDPLYVECEKCDGRGYFHDDFLDMDGQCPICCGRGSVPNPDLMPLFRTVRPRPE
jgi:hypothetical protein